MSSLQRLGIDKKGEVVAFASTAIALYGYDQGMMSLVNTNHDYLRTMGIAEEDPLVGIIVSVFYIGCAVGAVLASFLADKAGRKPGIFTCLAVSSIGNILMFIAGLNYKRGAMTLMFIGRIVMGLGTGGIDSVIPVYSSELNSEGGRGRALAKEFQANIFGLNMAFAINLAVTAGLGKDNQWGEPFPRTSEAGTGPANSFASMANPHYCYAGLSCATSLVHLPAPGIPEVVRFQRATRRGQDSTG